MSRMGAGNGFQALLQQVSWGKILFKKNKINNNKTETKHILFLLFSQVGCHNNGSLKSHLKAENHCNPNS